MRAFVTGASGFVGRTLFGMAGSGGIGGFTRVIPLTDEVDLREPESLALALAGQSPDAVIHLAAITFVPDSIARPRETYAVNLHGTINLLEALEQRGFRGAFLYVSSGASTVPATAAAVARATSPAEVGAPI